MKNPTNPGMNKTGLATAPLLSKEMLEIPGMTVPSSEGDGTEISQVRIEYAKTAEPTGTVPPPASLKEAAKTTMKALQGKKATVLTDKLGERLAFERSGTRLYQAIVSKYDAFGSWKGGPTREDLVEILNEEQSHFQLIKEIIEELGSDPTAVTPSANVHAVASLGLFQVVTDPRTDLRHSLEIANVAELLDNDCWENLIDLTRSFGLEEQAVRMEEALTAEQRHLSNVRLWVGAALTADAFGKMTAPFEERTALRELRKTATGEDKNEVLPPRPSGSRAEWTKPSKMTAKAAPPSRKTTISTASKGRAEAPRASAGRGGKGSSSKSTRR